MSHDQIGRSLDRILDGRWPPSPDRTVREIIATARRNGHRVTRRRQVRLWTQQPARRLWWRLRGSKFRA